MEDYEINRTARHDNLVRQLGYLDAMHADILRGLDMINPKGDNSATVRTAIASAKAAIVHLDDTLVGMLWPGDDAMRTLGERDTTVPGYDAMQRAAASFANAGYIGIQLVVQHFSEVLAYMVAVGAAMGAVSEEMPPLDKRTLN